MIFHIGRMYGNENLSLFPGTLAVQAFFIISGYLITQSFERSRTLKDCSIKRLRRIVPGLYFLIFNGSLWTLIVEVFFYIFIPILCFVFRSRIIIGAIVSIILSTIAKYILIKYQTIIEMNVPNFIYNALLKEYSSLFTTLSFSYLGSFYIN